VAFDVRLHVKIVCALSVESVGALRPDVLVLPERTTRLELLRAQDRWPHCIVVGAVAEGEHIRGHLFSGGTDHIEYLKVQDDSVSRGVRYLPERFIYESGMYAIAVMICRDLQLVELRERIRSQFQRSVARFKVVCIPGDMGSEWFSSEPHSVVGGAYLAMSNNWRMGYTRRASFIAAPDGHILQEQEKYEAIAADAT